MLRAFLVIGWFVLCVSTQTHGQASPSTTPNLVVNGGFEQGAAGWQFLLSGANGTGQVDTNEQHEGHASYKLVNHSGFGPNIYARLVQTVTGMRAYTTYRVSCWVKGRGCGINWIGGGPGWYNRHAFPKGDFDWQPLSFELELGANPDTYELMVLSESTTEALWVDDIRVEPVKVDRAKQDAFYAAIATQAAHLRQRLADLETEVHRSPDLEASPYTRLGIAVAKRFLEFAEKGTPDGRSSPAWSRLQFEEIAQVLDETERLVRSNNPVLSWRAPKPGTVRVKDGNFTEAGRPFYFAGYGHFASVIHDLPDFPTLGASLIQDGTAGPSSMNADGTLGAGALAVLHGLDRAAQYGMREDFLLSPHYYPAWANAPDLNNGNIGFLSFNIFHPKAKAAVQQWVQAMGKEIKNKPALHSVCLANEPVYISSGRDPYTRPLFTAYLKQKHPHLEDLNALYGTQYTNFDAVPLPGTSMPAGVGAQRAYYDWTTFNKQMFADWHAWLNTLVKQSGVKAPTHTKIMVFYSLDRDKLCYGVDPELMCHATDLAGCDAYAFMSGANTYDWMGQEFFYDLLHSFRGQSVFNSENHLIPDGSPTSPVPMTHSRSVLWQGALHHQQSTTIWVWEMAADPSLAGSIYFRPANVYGAGRAMLDLQRLAPEVRGLETAQPRVALFYSPPSVFWEEKYAGSVRSLYSMLTCLGENVTFVSERQLAEGTAPEVQWLVVPEATHVLSNTPAALAAFVKKGGQLLRVGKASLTRDEYDRPLPPLGFAAAQLDDGPPVTPEALRQALSPLAFHELRDVATGKPAAGIEFRVVTHGRATLVPLENLNAEAKTVSLPGLSQQPAFDLLSGERVDLRGVKVEPMVPRLLQIGGSLPRAFTAAR